MASPHLNFYTITYINITYLFNFNINKTKYVDKKNQNPLHISKSRLNYHSSYPLKFITENKCSKIKYTH